MCDDDSSSFATDPDDPHVYRQIRRALNDIRLSARRREWLHQNQKRARDTIRTGLRSKKLYAQALATLLTALPYVRDAYEAWTELLLVAVKHPDIRENPENVSCLYTALASFYTHMEQYDQAEKMLGKVKGWLSIEMADAVIAESCICLVESLLYHFDQRLSEDLLKTLLRHASAVSDPHVLARARHILCRACTVRGDLEKAIRYGGRALAYFTLIQDSDAIFRSALALAKAYRAGKEYILAERHLEIAREHVSDLMLPRERGDLYYELGAVAYARGAISGERNYYVVASSCFATAHKYFDQTTAPYRHAAFYHARGLLLLRLEQFDEAQVCLAYAEESWEKLNNSFECANTRYARSFAEAKRGDLVKARMIAQEAVLIMGPLPDTMSCDDLHTDLQQHIRHLMNGFYEQRSTK